MHKPNIINKVIDNYYPNQFNDITLDLSAELENLKYAWKPLRGKIKDSTKIGSEKKTYEKLQQLKEYTRSRPTLNLPDQEPEMNTASFLSKYVTPYYYTTVSHSSKIFLLDPGSTTGIKNKKMTPEERKEAIKRYRGSKKVELYEMISLGTWRAWELFQKFSLVKKRGKVKALFLTNNIIISKIEPYILFRERYSSGYAKDQYILYDFRDYLTARESSAIELITKFIERFNVEYHDIKNNICNKDFHDTDRELDFICSDIIYYKWAEKLMSEMQNHYFKFVLLKYITQYLKKGGNVAIQFRDIYTEMTAQLIFLYSTLFKKSYLTRVSNDSAAYPYQHFVGIGYKGASDKFITELNKIHQKWSETKSEMFCKTNINNKTTTFKSLIKIDKGNEYYKLLKQWNEVIGRGVSYHYDLINTLYDELEDQTFDMQRRTLSSADDYTIYASVEWFNKYDVPIKFKYSKKDIKNTLMQDLYSSVESETFKYIKTNKVKDIDIDYKKRDMDLTSLERTYAEYNTYQRVIDTVDYNKYRNIKFKVNLLTGLKKYLYEKGYTGSREPSQAFLKFYEILSRFNLLDKGTNIKSFHICEAPGQFIISTNHFVKTSGDYLQFDWYAQSLNAKHPDSIRKYGKGIFSDSYGLIRKYPEKWLWGKKRTGDIVDVENIESYSKYMDGIDIITSDCGLAKGTAEFGFIEEKMSLINFAQIFFMFYHLPEGKHCVFKTYLPFKTPFNISLLYLFYLAFGEVYAYKPSLNPGSTEFYIIGKNYHKLSDKVLNKLKKILKQGNSSSRTLLNVPNSFIMQHSKMVSELLNKNQVFIVKKLYVYENPDIFDDMGIDIDKQKKKAEKLWIKEYNFKKISHKDEL